MTFLVIKSINNHFKQPWWPSYKTFSLFLVWDWEVQIKWVWTSNILLIWYITRSCMTGHCNYDWVPSFSFFLIWLLDLNCIFTITMIWLFILSALFKIFILTKKKKKKILWFKLIWSEQVKNYQLLPLPHLKQYCSIYIYFFLIFILIPFCSMATSRLTFIFHLHQ